MLILCFNFITPRNEVRTLHLLNSQLWPFFSLISELNLNRHRTVVNGVPINATPPPPLSIVSLSVSLSLPPAPPPQSLPPSLPPFPSLTPPPLSLSLSLSSPHFFSFCSVLFSPLPLILSCTFLPNNHSLQTTAQRIKKATLRFAELSSLQEQILTHNLACFGWARYRSKES